MARPIQKPLPNECYLIDPVYQLGRFEDSTVMEWTFWVSLHLT